jgi:prepilin-type N-terminal cleavage/methylation domain-containing protein
MQARGFTLLEVTIAAVVAGIMAAVSVPVVLNAVQQKRAESGSSKVELAVNAGRDAARGSLRCVTVLAKLPYDANGTAGLAAYLHNSAACDEFFVDWEYPEGMATTVAQVRMHPSVVASVDVMTPTVGCNGTPPPLGCYTFNGGLRYLIKPDGTTDMPYRIHISRTDGSADDFVVQPATGTLRKEEQ